MTQKILLVEDDAKIARFVELELTHEGYAVTKSADGREALSFAEDGGFDLMLLDIMLPGLNGLEVLRRLRKTSDLPVIMLTARDAVMDKVSGLDSGADDYITKPFAIEELLARIRVVFKKRGGLAQRTRKMTVKGVTIDTDRYEVTCGGELVELNHREYELVRILMENENIVMNRQQLMNSVCGYDYMGETNIIDVYVRHIRSKIDNRFGFRFITTVRGVGYAVKEE